MPDTFTETKTTGFFTRIINSVVGVFVGILLFIASFGVLFWNEGRPSNYEVYQKASEASSNTIDNNKNGQFVYTKGKLTTDSLITDDLYLVPGKYSVIGRKVEMFSWVEKAESDSKSNTGGSETTTTTYKYSKDWSSDPQDSSRFKESTGHANPEKTISDETLYNPTAKIGNFTIDLSATTLPELTELSLNNSTNIPVATPTPTISIIPTITPSIVPTLETKLASNKYIYSGKTSLDKPEVGDIRISYSVLKSDIDVTAFAKQEDGTLKLYTDENGVKVFRIFTTDHDQALLQVKAEDTAMSWILRGVGFVMMWIGMLMILGPIATISDILPIVGKVTGFVLGLVTFIIALGLSILTIVISIIVHSTIALVIIGLIVIIIAVLLYMRKRNQPTSLNGS
jgi:hypothetical protein